MNTPVFTERFIARDQGRIHARDYAGTGPAFVLMHGFPDNSHIYDDLIPYLVAAGRRVVAFDFLGFGDSDKPAGAIYNFKQQLDDLKAVVDALDLGQIVPVMHDSSGAAGINFAIDYPENTASIVVLNSGFANAPTVKWPELIELFADAKLSALANAIIQSPEQFGWVVNFQRAQFKNSLADKHKTRYDAFLGQIIDGNFRKQGAGPAFVQMTSQFFAELDRNTTRIPLMEALTVPAKIIWGEKRSVYQCRRREGLPVPSATRVAEADFRRPLAANRRTRTTRKGDAVMTRTIVSKAALPLTRFIKFTGFGVIAAILMVMSSTISFAQAERPLDPNLVAPTTKVLAIGTFTAKATPAVSKPVLPSEVRDTVKLYLDGKIDQWFIKQDQSGVVFLMNVTDVKEAHALLEKLPLGQAGLMEFQLIPLGPITPLRMLLSQLRNDSPLNRKPAKENTHGRRQESACPRGTPPRTRRRERPDEQGPGHRVGDRQGNA